MKRRRKWSCPRHGARAWACGIVTKRQQPETAKGVIFVTLEDETGKVNIVVIIDRITAGAEKQ